MRPEKPESRILTRTIRGEFTGGDHCRAIGNRVADLVMNGYKHALAPQDRVSPVEEIETLAAENITLVFSPKGGDNRVHLAVHIPDGLEITPETGVLCQNRYKYVLGANLVRVI